MENNDKLNKQETYVKREKRSNTCEIKSETHTSSSNIETTHDVCKCLQNQKIHNTKNISILMCIKLTLPLS